MVDHSALAAEQAARGPRASPTRITTFAGLSTAFKGARTRGETVSPSLAQALASPPSSAVRHEPFAPSDRILSPPAPCAPRRVARSHQPTLVSPQRRRLHQRSVGLEV